jgi:hypothetical protein
MRMFPDGGGNGLVRSSLSDTTRPFTLPWRPRRRPTLAGLLRSPAAALARDGPGPVEGGPPAASACTTPTCAKARLNPSRAVRGDLGMPL